MKYSILFFFLICLTTGCQPVDPVQPLTREMKKELDQRVLKAMKSNSIQALTDTFQIEQNNYGLMVIYKHEGRSLRENAQFNEAIESHRKELELAIFLNDTIEMIQAYNNIGTDFRRMGILDEASNFHYKALDLSDDFSDQTSYEAIKNGVISLNGIGNVYMSINNLEVAENAFRKALHGEQQLKSYLGQAINYANIGNILEINGQTDSARYYYQQSMECNEQAQSELGIALCHFSFGQLAAKEKDWKSALHEYKQAYTIMKDGKDPWHWLKSCIALAGIYIQINELEKGLTYLQQAIAVAQEINSTKSIAEIYGLLSAYHEKKGQPSKALETYKKSIAWNDSIDFNKSKEHIQNSYIKYAREKGDREVNMIKEAYRSEQQEKRIILVGGITILVLAVLAILMLLYIQNLRMKRNRTLRQVERMRTTFFTNITHEFRTPLTVILGLVEQLQLDQGLSEKQEKSLSAIERQGKNLLDLVNQLLDISKLMAKTDFKQWYHGDVVVYIRMLMENYKEYAHTRNIHIQFTPQNNEIQMDFIPEYFDKILRNLIANALKYTPENGFISINIQSDGQLFTLKVTDTGIGIPKEDLPHVFDSFYQGSNNNGQTGTGIGLHFVRQMTESMGGRISASNQKGHGAIFTIELPLNQPQADIQQWIPEGIRNIQHSDLMLEEEDEDNQDQERKQPVLLVVEDNTDIAYYICSLLQNQYRVVIASNGKEGLDKANKQMPDLILTDLMMPEMDGYMLCQEIRKSEALNHIPIIVITAKSEENDRIKGLEMGADAYLIKPFNAQELYVRVSKLLEQRERLRNKYSEALQTGNTEEVKLSCLDRDFINRLTSFIHLHLTDKDLSVDLITEAMYMSKSQLNRKIRTITGHSTASYILQIRMEKAKRLLASSELAIGEIAMKCGFEDSSYFTRVFKQLFNLTPSQYRKTPLNKE